MKKYHTLLSRTPGELWAIEFGDYDRECVRQEMQDQLYHLPSHGWPKGTKFKIITTGDKQADITAGVAVQNSLIETKALTEKRT